MTTINNRQLTSKNQDWLSELESLISEKIEHSDLIIQQIAHGMAVSPRHLGRRLKALVDLSKPVFKNASICQSS